MIWKRITMKTTSLVITIAVITLGIYDLVAVLSTAGDGEVTASISAFFFQIGFKAPMVVFTIGFICGHLFGYVRLEK